MSVQYHPLTPGHSEQASQLMQRVIRTYNVADYTEDGIQSLMEFTGVESVLEILSADKSIGFGASVTLDEDTKLVGVCLIRDWQHLLLFFVDGDYHNQGIGRTLFEMSLAECRAKNPKLKTMTVNSTVFALEAYKKLGFIAETDEPQARNGIVFVPMRRPL